MCENSKSSLKHKCEDIKNRLFVIQDGASLAVFRIIIGVLMMRDVPYLIFSAQQSMDGFRARYYGFDWVQPDETLIYLCAALLPFAAFCVTLGLFYRLAMPITTIIVAYIFIITPEYYLNHYYMLLLFCALLSVMPANKVWALDARIKSKDDDNDDSGVPAWNYWLLKGQTEIILIYAGLVKINADWLNLQPLSAWIRSATHDFPTPMRWFFYFDAPIAIGAYGVILLHIVGAPLLLYRRTRIWVFGLYVCFHLTNSMMFDIGIFPYMTIATTLLFFNPDWPRRVIQKMPPLTTRLSSLYVQRPRLRLSRMVIITLMGAWMLVQIINPLPALLASNLAVAWHGHGDLFTWRMMLNNKSIYTVVFAAHMPDKQRIEFVPIDDFLSKRECFRVTGRPNTTVQFADYLADHYRAVYSTDQVDIHAYIVLSINYREPELWADPTVDLSSYRSIYGIQPWLTSVTKPRRTWEDYIHAPDYQNPTYGEILNAMKLPQEETITFDISDATLDERPTIPKCK
tara:strand:+ start:14855 stop:16396 length:1542 start_codon:yes stop_codon:yes gene_type:complete